MYSVVLAAVWARVSRVWFMCVGRHVIFVFDGMVFGGFRRDEC